MAVQKKNFFPKTPSGISGLDEITNGGFPKGRPVLICAALVVAKHCSPCNFW